jgi:hypothetical protein
MIGEPLRPLMETYWGELRLSLSDADSIKLHAALRLPLGRRTDPAVFYTLPRYELPNKP